MLSSWTGYLSNFVSGKRGAEDGSDTPEQSKKRKLIDEKTRDLYQAELMMLCNEVMSGAKHVEIIERLMAFLNKALKEEFIDDLDFNAKIAGGNYKDCTVLYCLIDLANSEKMHQLLTKVLNEVSLEKLAFEAVGKQAQTPLIKLATLFYESDEPCLLEVVLKRKPVFIETLDFSNQALGLIARGVYQYNRAPDLLITLLKAHTPGRCQKFKPCDPQMISLAAFKVGTVHGKNHALVSLAYQFVQDYLALKEQEYLKHQAQKPEPSREEGDEEKFSFKKPDLLLSRLMSLRSSCKKPQQRLSALIEGKKLEEPSTEGLYWGRRTHAEMVGIMQQFRNANAEEDSKVGNAFSCKKI